MEKLRIKLRHETERKRILAKLNIPLALKHVLMTHYKLGVIAHWTELAVDNPGIDQTVGSPGSLVGSSHLVGTRFEQSGMDNLEQNLAGDIPEQCQTVGSPDLTDTLDQPEDIPEWIVGSPGVSVGIPVEFVGILDSVDTLMAHQDILAEVPGTPQWENRAWALGFRMIVGLCYQIQHCVGIAVADIPIGP